MSPTTLVVVDLLREVQRVADLPVNDPERAAWLSRKDEILEWITLAPASAAT